MGIKRARSGEEKTARREGIIDAAESLFAEKGYEATTAQDIATRAGVAKGSIFDYFGSKEEIFLALAGRLYRRFVARVTDLVQSARESTRETLRALLVASLASDPDFRAIMAILGPSIERNASVEAIRSAKQGLLDGLVAMGVCVETRFPFMPHGGGAAFLYRVYGIALGFEALANPCSKAKSVIESDHLDLFRFEFEKELSAVLDALLKAIC